MIRKPPDAYKWPEIGPNWRERERERYCTSKTVQLLYSALRNSSTSTSTVQQLDSAVTNCSTFGQCIFNSSTIIQCCFQQSRSLRVYNCLMVHRCISNNPMIEQCIANCPNIIQFQTIKCAGGNTTFCQLLFSFHIKKKPFWRMSFKNSKN